MSLCDHIPSVLDVFKVNFEIWTLYSFYVRGQGHKNIYAGVVKISGEKQCAKREGKKIQKDYQEWEYHGPDIAWEDGRWKKNFEGESNEIYKFSVEN